MDTNCHSSNLKGAHLLGWTRGLGPIQPKLLGWTAPRHRVPDLGCQRLRQEPSMSSGLPSFLSCRIKSLYSDEVSEPHSGRICRTDRPSGDKTMGGHGENDQPRRQSLQLSLFVFPAKNEGKLEVTSPKTARSLCQPIPAPSVYSVTRAW